MAALLELERGAQPGLDLADGQCDPRPASAGERGVEFVEPEPVDYAYGVRITALDPDGNRLELRQRPRGWSKER